MQTLRKCRTDVAAGERVPAVATLAKEVQALMTGTRCFSCGGMIAALSFSAPADVLICKACGAEVEEIEDPVECVFAERLSPAA